MEANPSSSSSVTISDLHMIMQMIDELKPYFGTNQENIDSWVKQLDKVAEIARMSDAEVFILAKLKLQGDAEEWWFNKKKEIDSWATLKNKLTDTFGAFGKSNQLEFGALLHHRQHQFHEPATKDWNDMMSNCSAYDENMSTQKLTAMLKYASDSIQYSYDQQTLNQREQSNISVNPHYIFHRQHIDDSIGQCKVKIEQDQLKLAVPVDRSVLKNMDQSHLYLGPVESKWPDGSESWFIHDMLSPRIRFENEIVSSSIRADFAVSQSLDSSVLATCLPALDSVKSDNTVTLAASLPLPTFNSEGAKSQGSKFLSMTHRQSHVTQEDISTTTTSIRNKQYKLSPTVRVNNSFTFVITKLLTTTLAELHMILMGVIHQSAISVLFAAILSISSTVNGRSQPILKLWSYAFAVS